MTTAQANQSFGSPESLFSSSDIASALETSGVADLVRGQLRGFTQATRSQAVNEVERITAELIDLNPLQVIIDAQIASLHMLFSLVFEIQALTATVRAGRLTVLQIGRCDATGSVGIEGRPIAHRQAQVKLPVSIPLGAGLPLVTHWP
jgi:hypothetical protein